jgi:hypothetical protein
MRIEAGSFRRFPPVPVVYIEMTVTELGKRDV